MGDSKIRQPAVAGQFYPDSAQALKRELERLIDKEAKKLDAKAVMLPHAGYIYSGKVAGLTISSVKMREKVLLLGPNHTGYGASFSIITEGLWRTPLGDVEIESHLAKTLLKNCSLLEEDDSAHRYEHCLEVEVPFLKYMKDDIKIVPIIVGSEDTSELKRLALCISKTIKQLNMVDNLLIIASSDMTHYEPEEMAKEKDHLAIEAIIKLDEDLLIERAKKYRISMCGVFAVYVMLVSAKDLGAKEAKLIKYQTSADTNLDTESVVGYAGVVIF